MAATARNFMNRRNGVMKKANTLYRIHGARTAVLIEMNSTLYCYRSHQDWPPLNMEVDPANCFTSDNFETVADRTLPEAEFSLDSLLRPCGLAISDDSSLTALGSSTSSSAVPSAASSVRSSFNASLANLPSGLFGPTLLSESPAPIDPALGHCAQAVGDGEAPSTLASEEHAPPEKRRRIGARPTPVITRAQKRKRYFDQ